MQKHDSGKKKTANSAGSKLATNANHVQSHGEKLPITTSLRSEDAEQIKDNYQLDVRGNFLRLQTRSVRGREKEGGGRWGWRGGGWKENGLTSLQGTFFAKALFIFLCEMEFRFERVSSFTLAFSQHWLSSPRLQAVIFVSTMIFFGTCGGDPPPTRTPLLPPIFQFQKTSSTGLQPSVIDVIIIRAHLKL